MHIYMHLFVSNSPSTTFSLFLSLSLSLSFSLSVSEMCCFSAVVVSIFRTSLAAMNLHVGKTSGSLRAECTTQINYVCSL